MFPKAAYENRRKALMDTLGSGVIFFPGNQESPANFAGNPYPFRQDSSFLYFCGLDEAGLNAVIDIDAGTATVFGDDPGEGAAIWSGPSRALEERCLEVGAAAADAAKLEGVLREASAGKRPVHYLPPYRPEHRLLLGRLFEEAADMPNRGASEELIRAVVDLRSRKSPAEIDEIEDALEVTAQMHLAAMEGARPGVYEREIAAAMSAIALAAGMRPAYAPIFSVQGEILHNPSYANRMAAGDLAVNDAGAESARHYAADITRTFPVGGTFTSRQRDVYQVVLDAQKRAIGTIRPGIAFRQVHDTACLQIAAGLKELGLMRGDSKEAVAAGAHALFFPHGLGHMLGLDVHDMEALGEDYVGYGSRIRRDERFGTCYLRLARELEAGFVVTVEPGIYFISELIGRWREKKRFLEFIDYDRVEAYQGFGGIRIEDDVLVTQRGFRVLGPPIPRTVEAIEALTNA